MIKPGSIGGYDSTVSDEISQIIKPTELINKLFEKSCVLMRSCLLSLEKDEDEEFQKSSLHALQIVLSLRYVLDTSNGDELSADLYDTYTSIAASLLKARTDKNKGSVKKIYEALKELGTAWANVDRETNQG